jgi:hypothetical protein
MMKPAAADATDDDFELLTRDNQQLQLLGQGGYGCAFYPEINCKTHHIEPQSRHYLSKIQYQDESLVRELLLGKMIVQKMPKLYRYYFAPIVESCPVSLSQLKQDKIRQCEVLSSSNSASNSKPIVSSKIPYVGKMTLLKYFDSLFQPEKCRRSNQCQNVAQFYLKQLLSTYRYLITSFDKLNRTVGVVHLDVKNDNIMYDSKNAVPIVIDFGMGYPVAALVLPAYLKFPYPFGIQSFSYSPWCIEVSMLTRVARDLRRDGSTKNQHGGYVDEALLKTIVPESQIAEYQIECGNFVQNNLSRSVFTDADRARVRTQFQDWIAVQARQKTFQSLWTALVKTHPTWDLYSLAFMYLRELESSGILEQPNHSEVINQFLALLKDVVLSTPGQRPGARDMFLAVKTLLQNSKNSMLQGVVLAKRNPTQAAQEALELQQLRRLK